MGKKKPTQRITEYYTSIQYAICHGVVEKLISIRVNDKIVGKCASMIGPVIYINDEKLFGGPKKEGGLKGRLAWQSGTDDQLLDYYVASKKGKLPSQLPGYRGIATAFFTEWPGSGAVGAETGVIGSIIGGLNIQVSSSFGLSSFLSGGRKAPMKGFYWSANQPVIPPVHFRVTRIDRSWLPEIAAIPGDVDLERIAICIAIDCSLSMRSDGKLGIVKTATIQLLQDLKNAQGAATYDVRVVGWSGDVQALEKRDCTSEDYDELIAFVEGLGTSYGTFFTNAVVDLEDFYEGSKGKCRSFLFLTDGIADSPANADSAAATLAATGAESHAFSLVETDTVQTAKMDNTPSDGVPVLNLDLAPMRLRNLFRATGTHQIDMNPAHIIRECLVNTVWGLGLPESALNSDMFEDAARTLYEERFGLSMMWTRQAEVQEFVGEILSHIQGVIYVNPMSGLICLKLIRNDYDPDELDILTPSNSKVTSFKRRSPAEVTNEINVTWTNPISEKEEVVTRQSLGSIVANNGEVVPDNRNYYGVRRAGLAAALCDRDLAAATAPLSTAEVKANRAFSLKVPGDVVKLTDPENGADGIIMRIMKIDYGYVGDSEVELTLTEDIFSYAKARFIEPPTSGNTNPSEFPRAPIANEILTTNAFMNKSLSDGIDDLVDPETQVAFLIATDSSDTFNSEIYQEVTDILGATSFESIGEFDLVGRALLTEQLDADVESEMVLPVPSVGYGPNVGAFLIIGASGLPEDHHEIALITAIDSGTGAATIKRALMDTVPWDWPVGTPVRYMDQLTRVVNPNSTVSGVSADYRIHSQTSLGLLPDQLAPVVTYQATDRLYAPARPAGVTVGGAAFGAIDGLDLTTIDVTWETRNRLTEDGVLLAWDEASVTPEVDQTTTVRLIDHATDTVIIEYDGLTGTTHTFDTADCGAAYLVRVQVVAVRDGLESIQGHSVLVDRTPLLPPENLTIEVL